MNTNYIINKKGVVASQLSFIFIIIAGALILTLLIRFAFTYKTISETRINIMVSSKIKAAIQSFGTSEESKTRIQTANAVIHNSCDGIKILGSSSLKMNIFSTPELKPELGELFLFTKKLNIPFYLTNIIVLIEPETRIFVVGDTNSGVGSDLIDAFPLELGVEEKELSEFNNIMGEANKVENKVLIIVVDDGSEEFRNVKNEIKEIDVRNKDIHLYIVKEIKPGFGQVIFYKVNKNKFLQDKKPRFYFDNLIVGAVTSTNEIYSCNLDRTLEQLLMSVDVYVKRYELLSQSGFLNNNCKQATNKLINELNKIRANVEGLIEKVSKNEATKNDFEKVYDSLMKLEDYNNELIYMSCPEIY